MMRVGPSGRNKSPRAAGGKPGGPTRRNVLRRLQVLFAIRRSGRRKTTKTSTSRRSARRTSTRLPRACVISIFNTLTTQECLSSVRMSLGFSEPPLSPRRPRPAHRCPGGVDETTGRRRASTCSRLLGGRHECVIACVIDHKRRAAPPNDRL